MGSLSASVFCLVILVQFQLIVTKPFFAELFCDLFCDDDDVTSTSTTTSASTEDDYFGFEDMCDCARTTRRPPASNIPASINMILPPSNGMNLSMINNNGQWSFGLNAVPNGLGNIGTTTAPTTTSGTPPPSSTAAA